MCYKTKTALFFIRAAYLNTKIVSIESNSNEAVKIESRNILMYFQMHMSIKPTDQMYFIMHA